MNQKALKTLEFEKIIHILTAHAASEGSQGDVPETGSL